MKRFLAFLLPFLTILSVLFIFSNSLASASEVMEKKSAVVEMVERMIEWIIGKKIDSNAEALTVVSKIAHVIEFAAFAFFFTLSIAFYGDEVKNYFERILLAGGMVALADEHLQLYSIGRYSSVRDVMIDLTGILIGFWIASFLIWLIHRRKKNA